jgi:hypothetical protein
MLKKMSAIALLAALAGPQETAALGAEITVSGTVAGKGAPCVQFRLSSGETISLQSASPQNYEKGARLRLTGVWLRVSNCMQGRAFRVSSRVKI